MCQGEGQVAALEEDQADAQKQHLRPASTVQGNVTMTEMQPSQMSGDFKRALDLVVPATLVIKATATRSFDGEASSSYYATGFVVDAARGLILTNRHVVTPGPVTAEAIFLNREELPVRPLYYDPIHDFGFFRFDPCKVQFMPVTEVKLRPEAAAVGLEVRVVGNDSGEKISILAGTLARLDRDAPHYTKKGYNDFNTFYLQAASGTKGGSSGSPVVNCAGEVVALNAGGKNKAASAFYLPLERVVRALHLLQGCHDIGEHPDAWRGPVIPRGDLQATFVFKGFNEVQRLGLTHATEAAVRAASRASANSGESEGTTGMLVVDSVIPGGPADGLLEPGDVLVRIQGQVIVHFLPMEALLDDHVGQHVTVEIERGGELLVRNIRVQDLHAVSPSSFLEVAGGVVHGLSYQQARNNTSKVGQVYVAEPGYMLSRGSVPKGAIITQLAGEATPDVAAFVRQLARLKHGQRVPLQYYLFNERHWQKTAILHIDYRWYGEAQHWTRDDAHGTWNSAKAVLSAAEADEEPKQQASLNGAAGEAPIEADMDEDTEEEGEDEAPAAHLVESQAERVRRSLVTLDINLPSIALPDGVHCRSFTGSGVIVHQSEKLGLVVTDRNTVPVSVGDIMVSFGAHPAEVEAKIRFLHPQHNFAILSYDPADLPVEARERVVPAILDPSAIQDGDKVALIGLNKATRAMARNSTVINACFSLNIAPIAVPRYRAVNEEVVKLDLDFGDSFSGVLVYGQDHLRALWASYSEQVNDEDRETCAGLQAAVFAPWVERIAAEAAAASEAGPPAWDPPSVSLLDMELEPVLLSKAAQLGLPAQWVARLARLDNQRRQVLRVRSCLAGSNARSVLKDGDILLTVAGRAVSHFQAVEAAVAGSRVVKAARNPAACSTMPGVASSSDIGDAASEGTMFKPGQSQASECLRSKRPGSAHTADSSGSNAFKRARTVSSALLDLLPLASDASTVDNRAQEADLSEVAAGSTDAAAEVQLKICRDGKVQKVAIQLAQDHGLGTRRLVHWCGAQFQAPHRAVKEAGALPESCGVFISRWHHGSPAHRYALYALQFVQEVNGVPTPDLEAFVQAISKLEDEAFVRIKLVSCETLKSKVLSLKQDLKYWPTWELVLDTATSAWTRRNITAMHSKL